MKIIKIDSFNGFREILLVKTLFEFSFLFLCKYKDNDFIWELSISLPVFVNYTYVVDIFYRYEDFL